MIKKIKNMVVVMTRNYDKSLIEKYEDEIDRSKMLIDKSVIGSLTFIGSSKLKSIELYYISLISQQLERMVDRLICLDKSSIKFLNEIIRPIEILQGILNDTSKLEQQAAIEFAKAVLSIKKIEVRDIISYDMASIKQNLTTISEVIMDWMVTLKIED